MTAILTEYSNVRNAINFMDRFNRDSPLSDNFLYVGIGHESEWADDSNPPIPNNTKSDISDFWDNSIGFQQVESNDITLVKTRVDWESGKEFYEFDSNSNTAFYTDFYCVVPDDSNEARVWMVWNKYGGSGATTTTPPSFQSASFDGNGNYTEDTGDGYVWKYLYNITVNDWRDIADKNWIPVNFDHKVTNEQETYGDVNTARLLFSRHAMVRIKIDDVNMPVGFSYRQVAVVANPRSTDGGLLTDTVGLMGDYATDGDDVVKESGDTIYLENRTPIPRETDQQEEIKIVIRF